jgi:ankyrin repeat protein
VQYFSNRFSPLLQSSGHLTPLHEAALNGHKEMVKELLELGADDSIQNSKGHRAFDLAVKSRHLTVVQYLLSDGKFCSGVVPFKVPPLNPFFSTLNPF